MEQDDHRVATRRHEAEGVGSDQGPRSIRLPVLEDDVVADIAVTEPGQDAEHPRIVGPGRERAAEPRSRVDSDDLPDDGLRGPDVGRDTVVGQERQPGVVEAVVADGMTVGSHPPGEVGLGLDPATLEEPGGPNVAFGEDLENRLADARPMRPIRMLGVEGQRDPEPGARLRRAAYFSTPLITRPRVKKRWKTRKMTMGITIVSRVPAWMYAWLR